MSLLDKRDCAGRVRTSEAGAAGANVTRRIEHRACVGFGCAHRHSRGKNVDAGRADIRLDLAETGHRTARAEIRNRRLKEESRVDSDLFRRNAGDRKSTRLNSSHVSESRMPSSA